MLASDNLPEVLSVRQAADVLGIHPDTVRRWDAQGKLRAIRIGPRGARQYARHDVLRLSHAQDERTRSAQRVVVEVARAIAGSLDLHDVAKTVVHAAVNIVGSDRCAIYLVNYDQGLYEPLFAVDVKMPDSTALFYANPVPMQAMPMDRLGLEQDGIVVLDDTETHPLSNPDVFRRFNTRTFIAVGMRGDEGSVFGVMTFGWRDKPHFVRDDDVFFAQSLGALAEVALSNARLFAQREQERARALAINTVLRNVNSGRDLSSTLTNAITSLVNQLHADEGAIWMTNADQTAVIGAAETRIYGQSRIGAGLLLADSPNIAQVAAKQAPALITINEALGEERRWFESLEVQASLFVPLITQDAFVGIAFVNYLQHTPHLTGDDFSFANALAGQCALAIERVRLLEAAEQRAAELEAVIEQMGEGLIMLDRDGRIVLVNRYAAQLYGMPEAADDPGSFNPLLCAYNHDGTPIPPEELPVYRAARYGETTTNVEFRIRRADGSESIISGNASPIVNSEGERLGAVVILQDVTARRKLETEKDQFLSIVSHELKTPLTTIKGLNDLARRRLTRGRSVDDVLPNLETVGQQVQRMEHLIGDLLDMRRLENGVLPLSMASVNLPTLLHEACERAQATTDKHKILLDVPEAPVFVQADHRRLEQVLDNLLSNAIKYSPNGGIIELTLLHENAWAVLRVSDRGIGIPEHGRERLFERFYRGANVVASEYSGMGIGLALSRNIVERHGGTLELESTSPTGSTFRLALPLPNQAATGEQPVEQTTGKP